MNKFRLLGFVAATVFSNASFAAAFQLYELGTPIIGTAGVGQAAVAEDASTAYFNPAGMTLLDGTQFMLGSQMLITYANFSKDTATTISGNNGNNAGALIPGMSVYYSYSYSPQLKFGISMTSPYGGALSYNDGWVGRYNVQGVQFYTINLNPSVAYRFNNWLSVGAGAAIEYINLQQTVALPIIPEVDGQAKVRVSDFAPGFNAGVMLTPYTSTKIGVAYRSQIVHNMHGDTTFLRIALTPHTSTKLVMASNIILSASQDVSDQITLLGELGWADWSSMRDSILTVDNFSANTPQDWKNTYRFGLGGQYKFNPCLLFQLGVSYDTSPTTRSKRLPELPMDKQIRAGVGVMYKIIRPVTLSASYEYINFGKANIDNVSTDGVLSGSYSRNYANTLQIGLNVEV